MMALGFVAGAIATLIALAILEEWSHDRRR